MKKTQALIVGAAIAGLLAGVSSAQARETDQPDSLQKKGDKDKNCCKGKNSCKGKGGCKSGDNGCKGKNSCKAKGGCKTANDCDDDDDTD